MGIEVSKFVWPLTRNAIFLQMRWHQAQLSKAPSLAVKSHAEVTVPDGNGWYSLWVMEVVVISVALSAPGHQPETSWLPSCTFKCDCALFTGAHTCCKTSHIFTENKAGWFTSTWGKSSKHRVTSSQLPVSSCCHGKQNLHTLGDWWMMSQ